MYQNDRHIHCTRTAHGKASGVNNGVSPRRPTPFPGSVRAGTGRRSGRVFRPEQGALPELRLPGAEHSTLRHPLLSGGGSRRRDDGPDARALERAAVGDCSTTSCAPASRSSSTPIAPHFRQTTSIADEMDEGTGGVTERSSAAWCCRSRAPTRSERPCARTRDGPRVPVRHHLDEISPGHRWSGNCRCGSWRGWRNICR